MPLHNNFGNKGALAIFVKTPSLSPIKTRLIKSIREGCLKKGCNQPKNLKQKVENFYLQLVKSTQQTVHVSQKFIPGLTPYWAVAEKNCLYNKCWKKFKTIWQGNGTLGERLYNIYNKLIKKYSYVILIGADCPELSTAEFVCASGILQLQSDLKKYVIGKTYDGGFYLFGANFRISKNIWTSIPYSHPQTAKLLTKKLDNLQAQSFQLRQLRDIDTIEDALYYLCQTPYY